MKLCSYCCVHYLAIQARPTSLECWWEALAKEVTQPEFVAKSSVYVGLAASGMNFTVTKAPTKSYVGTKYLKLKSEEIGYTAHNQKGQC